MPLRLLSCCHSCGIILIIVESNNEILNDPFTFPKTLSFTSDNYSRALSTLKLGMLYQNTFIIAAITIIIELLITFMSSYALSRMVFR